MATKTNLIITRSSSSKRNSTISKITENRPEERIIVIDSSSESENESNSPFLKPRKPLKTPTKIKNATSSQPHKLSPVTPPKQRKYNNDKTDNSESPKTPSSLLKTLQLNSPTVKRRPLSTKKLFSTEDKNKPEKNQYQNARSALHSNFPVEMPGRENEIEEIRRFVEDHLNEETSGSIYISGPPGTGKTASLNLILEDADISSKVNKVYINCTGIKSAQSAYSRLNKELNVKVKGKSEKDNLNAIEKYLKKKHKHILLVLDEIDQLENKNQSILYSIFEWPAQLNSKLILIGISNALDLTDRMLPRLQARCELIPKLLHFTPYTKEQIVNIFVSRLKNAGVSEIFSPVAIQMLAGKVAAVSGDVRRALDIGRRVIELIDDKRNNDCDILKSVENFTNELEINNVKKVVNLQEVVGVLNNIYGTAQNLNNETDESFPLQQKIILCSLLLMLKKVKSKDITIGKLHEIYSKLCTKQNLTAVDQVEFVGLCSLIETRGIIRVTGRKEPRMHKINLEWNEKEVCEALKDKQLISTILQDDSCLERR